MIPVYAGEDLRRTGTEKGAGVGRKGQERQMDR